MANRNRLILNVVVMNGAGTHMIADLLEAMGFYRITETDTYWPALVLARRNPDIPVIYRSLKGVPASDVVDGFHGRVGLTAEGDPLDAENCRRAIGRLVEGVGREHLFVINVFPLVYSGAPVVAADSGEAWTLEDRDQARRALRTAAEENGYRYAEIAQTRHPVDIFLSNRERFGGGERERLLVDQIDEYFALVDDQQAREGIPVVRFEDLCTGNHETFRAAVARLGLDDDAIERALAIPHSGAVDKWTAYPASETRPVADRLGRWIERFGYRYHVPTGTGLAASYGRQALRNWAAEFGAINRVVGGDYSADSAFSRHRRSLLAAAYLRLLVLWPPFRRNYENLFKVKYRTPVPMRPLWKAVLARLRGRAE